MKPMLGAALTALVAIVLQIPVQGTMLKLDAPELFEKSVTHHLRLAEKGGAIELEAGQLFEDDGPAAGHSYQQPRNQETLTRDTWIKKDLFIPNPQAQAAFLLVLSDGQLEGAINGVRQQLVVNQSGRQSFKSFAFDPKLLRAGHNEIVLHGSGNVFVARDDEFARGSLTRTRHPNRSAKSTDAGQTWDYDHLGPDGKLDGEYGVRVFLEHYQPLGVLTTPVIDGGNLEGKPVGDPIRQLGPITIFLEAEPVQGGQTLVRARSGSRYASSDPGWSEWQTLGPTGGTIMQPMGRYVQIAVEISTQDGLQTPKVRGLTVTAQPARLNDWTAHLHWIEEHNQSIVRTSIPFEFEPFNLPRLKELREKYKLDEIVKGAATELEVMLRLAQWACNYWEWPNHITEQYPPWDALEILKPHSDGTPVGGFCLQFNLVFLQACESLGFSGRVVSISQGRLQAEHPGGGHEIVELWSNQWRKWVYVDGALAWYVVDRDSGVPLSIWELRERQLELLQGKTSRPVHLVDAARTKNTQFLWNGLAAPKPLNWYLELRMIPRSNFLQERFPLPLNQGTEEWCWNGHYVWTDDKVPAALLFGQRISKRSDFEWTLNQAHYALEAGETPGAIRVHLDTETPGFETFLAETDGGSQRPVASGFMWKLHTGKNQLRVWPRNKAGREGSPSWLTVEYQ